MEQGGSMGDQVMMGSMKIPAEHVANAAQRKQLRKKKSKLDKARQ
jgi:hypothetical protein